MRYYDQHSHTYYSPDSTEHFENYLKQTDLPVVTTEHVEDYYNLILQGIKEAPYANVLAHFDYGLRGYDVESYI